MAFASYPPCNVIPGRAAWREPGIQKSEPGAGFRVRSPRGERPGMTAIGFASISSYPVAMKTVRHWGPDLHQRCGARLDVGSVEYREIAAVFRCAPYHHEHPAIAFGGVV